MSALDHTGEVVAFWSVEVTVRYEDGHTGQAPILTPGRTAQLAATRAAETLYERLRELELPVVGVQAGLTLGPIFKCGNPAAPETATGTPT